jgi:hypothetical protein
MLLYHWAVRDLTFRAGANIKLVTVDQPLQRIFEAAPGAFSYEPIALIEFGIGSYFFSPLNALLGFLLAILIGLNITLSYLGIIRQRSCEIGTGTGILAAISSLAVGGTCCAPVIFIALGITANATLLAALPWLLPLGTIFLLVSIVYLTERIKLYTLTT